MKQIGIALISAAVIAGSILIFEYFEDHGRIGHLTVGAVVVQPSNESTAKSVVLESTPRPTAHAAPKASPKPVHHHGRSHMDNDDHGKGKGDRK